MFRVPSAVSSTVNKLEEDLDIALFDRSEGRAALTAEGKLIVEQCCLILQVADELTPMTKQSASGWELEPRIGTDSFLRFSLSMRLVQGGALSLWAQ